MSGGIRKKIKIGTEKVRKRKMKENKIVNENNNEYLEYIK